MNRERFLYRGPAEKLAYRLARLEQHRRHVEEELCALERLLAQNPNLRDRFGNRRIGARLRLVVDNGRAHRKVVDIPDDDGPRAA